MIEYGACVVACIATGFISAMISAAIASNPSYGWVHSLVTYLEARDKLKFEREKLYHGLTSKQP